MSKIIVEIEWETPNDPHFINPQLIRKALSIHTNYDTKVTPVWEEPKEDSEEES